MVLVNTLLPELGAVVWERKWQETIRTAAFGWPASSMICSRRFSVRRAPGGNPANSLLKRWEQEPYWKHWCYRCHRSSATPKVFKALASCWYTGAGLMARGGIWPSSSAARAKRISTSGMACSGMALTLVPR